jgi:predicted DCC family thiol-disulfide oxidoreductase YuxK
MDTRYIIIFDGVCNFCNGAVNFIMKRDPEGLFCFTQMQSETAQELIDNPEGEINAYIVDLVP